VDAHTNAVGGGGGGGGGDSTSVACLVSESERRFRVCKKAPGFHPGILACNQPPAFTNRSTSDDLPAPMSPKSTWYNAKCGGGRRAGQILGRLPAAWPKHDGREVLPTRGPARGRCAPRHTATSICPLLGRFRPPPRGLAVSFPLKRNVGVLRPGGQPPRSE